MSLSTEAPTLTKAMLPTTDEIAQGRRRLHRKAAVIVAMAIGSYVGLVFAPVGVLMRVLFGCVLVVSLVAVATDVMHDGNHGSFSRSRANRLAGWTSDLLSGSSFLWRFKHASLNTNVVGYDTDIDQAPFARIAPQQAWHPWHRYQHICMWPLYGFLTLNWFLLSRPHDAVSAQGRRPRIADSPSQTGRGRDRGRQDRTSLVGDCHSVGAPPVVGCAGVLPRVLVARRLPSRQHLPTGALASTSRSS